MKEGWEIKKLGEVADVVNGYTPKVDELSTVGVYPYFKVAEMNILENSTIMTKTSTYVSCPKKIYKKGTIVFPKNGAAISTNKKRILGQDSVVDLNTAGFVANELLLIEFFYRFIQHIDFKRFVRRGAVPTLDMKELKESSIPVPPLAEQQRIVAELDCINGIIEKKKQQLKELDNLAQSIFYDMFGDPITNEKGWEVKKLGEVADIIGGSTPKTNIEENWIGNNNWISPAEIKDEKYIGRTEKSISDDAASRLTLLPVGTVLLSSRAPIGKLAITTIPMYCNQGFKNIVCGNKLNNEYVYMYMQLNVERLQALGVGATFKEVSKSIVSSFPIPLPPLSLQQSFAAKITTIEKQKSLIKQSIAEAETLLASRMDYYFN